MSENKLTFESIQDFCNRQIANSIISANVRPIIKIDPIKNPLKRLVGFASYDGPSYSKDVDHYSDAIGDAMSHQWNEVDSVKTPFTNIIKLQEKLICEKLISNRDKALEELVRGRLYNLNYKFRNDELFYSFVKNRITRVCDENNRDTEYLYLDYISEENRGVLLVTFSSNIEYDYDNFSGKITMSIG